MASSKTDHETLPVPDKVVRLSHELPSVVICNLRPEQRSNPDSFRGSTYREHPDYGDGEMISLAFERFLSWLESPIMVVMLYKDYSLGIFTIVVRLEPVICWTGDGLPCLEFEKPGNWNHCPNMWGGFVLAIAQVKGLQPTPVIVDPDCKHFIEIARQAGIPTPLPVFKSDLIVQIDLTVFQAFDRELEIRQNIPVEYDLQSNDHFGWEAGSFHGTAKVVSMSGNMATIVKLT